MEKHREKEVLVGRFNQLIGSVNSYIRDRQKGKSITHHYQVQLFIEFVNIAGDIHKSSLHVDEKSILWKKIREIYPVIKDLRERIGGKQSPIEKYIIEEGFEGKTKTIDEIKNPIERIKIEKEINLKIPFGKIKHMTFFYIFLFSLALVVLIIAGNIIFESFKNNPPATAIIPQITWNEDSQQTINLNNYFNDKDGDLLYFNSTNLINIDVEISETGTATLTPKENWYGAEKIVFAASDGVYYTESNQVLLEVINTADCGKDGCEQGEDCNNCAKDCGFCEGEEVKTTEPKEQAEKTENLNGKIEGLEKESEIDGYTSKLMVLFGITPGSSQGITSASKIIKGTSISAEKIEINPIPCVNLTESSTEQIEFNQVDIQEALVPKGYELLMPPFDIKCDKDDMIITLNVPSNYIDIKAMKCRGKKCNPTEIKETSKLKCGNEIVEEYLRKENYLLPDYMPVKITEKKGEISAENNIIESSGNKINFYGGFNNFIASIKMPEKAVPQPRNPSLMIIGTPLILKFDISETGLPVSGSNQEFLVSEKISDVSTEIIMPYDENTRIDENTIAVYVNVNNDLWEYVGGKIDTERKTVKADVKGISKYLNNENEVEFALMGSLCLSCLDSTFTKVYEPEIKTRDAVLLVHGLMSSPATFQDIINDIKLTKQPWNAYAYGYPSTKKIMENAIDLADQLQAHSDEYDNIYVVAHSLGGLIAQQALYYSYEQNKIAARYTYLNKVRKVILIGVPNKGSPAADVYKNLFDYLINIKTVYNLFNLNSELISDVVEGIVTPRIGGVDYYVIAGIKPYSFNMLFFKLTSKEPFDEYEVNDGLVSVTSAQYIGDEYVNDKCYDYWEVNVTHTELVDNHVARNLIERIVAKELMEGINNTAIIGHNKYFDAVIEGCSPEDKYIVIGKRVDDKETKDALGCKCGNGYCGEGEDDINCPSDCAVIKEEKPYSIVKYTVFFILTVLAGLSYRHIRKIKSFKKIKRKEKKEKEKSKAPEQSAAEPETKQEINVEKADKEDKKEEIDSSSFYNTEFDRFYNLIKEKGKIRAEEAAKILKLKKQDIIDWSKILESYKLITIKYLVFGGIELKKYAEKKGKKK